MNEPEVIAAARPVADALDRLGVPYYFVGSVASSLYGTPRSTVDADLVAALEESHAGALAAALAADFYVDEDMIREAIARQGMFNVIHNETAMKVDVYVLKRTPFDEESFRRRREDSFGDEPGSRTFVFGSAEDVLLYKLAWFRMGGEVSERQWKDVLGILRVQKNALDVAYLERWAVSLAVADLLARARSEAG